MRDDNLNKIFLTGKIDRTPTLRHTNTDKAVTNFKLSVERSYKTRKGRDEVIRYETHNFPVVCWSGVAQRASHLKKHDKITIEGELRSTLWEKADGSINTSFEVVASKIELVHRKRLYGNEEGYWEEEEDDDEDDEES